MKAWEKELIERSKKGDEAAFGTIVELYRPKICHLCDSIVHDEAAAEDLAQETFVHAVNHLSSFRMESSFYTWIYRIAKNLSFTYLKKKRRQESGELIEQVADLPKEDEEVDPRLLDAINELPEKQRIVFEMFVLKKIPHKEIAAKLGISPGTVRSRLYYAKRRLKNSVILG